MRFRGRNVREALVRKTLAAEKVLSKAPEVCTLVGRLGGFTPEETDTYLTYAGEWHSHEPLMVGALSHVYEDKLLYVLPTLLDALTRSAELYEEGLNHSLVQRIAARNITEKDVDAAIAGTYGKNLLQWALRRTDPAFKLSEEVRDRLKTHVMTLPELVCEEQMLRLQLLREYTAGVSEIAAGSTQLARQCLDDLMVEMKTRHTTDDIVVELICSEELPAIFDRFAPWKYRYVLDRKLTSALEMLPANESSHAIITALHHATHKLDKQQLGSLLPMLGAVPEVHRLEFLDELAGRPAMITSFSNLRKMGMGASEYFRFDAYAKQTPIADMTLLELTEELSRTPALRANARFVVDRGQDIAGFADSAVIELLRTYVPAELLLSDICDTLASDDRPRTELLMRVGELKPEAGELKWMRKKIASIDPPGIAELLESDDMVRSLSRYAQERVAVKVPVKQPDPKPKPADPEWMRAAYAVLPTTLHRRIRQVGRENPGQLETFCREVQQYGAQNVYQLVLREPDLFNAYLIDPKRRKKIDSLIGKANPLVEAQSLFLTRTEAKREPGVGSDVSYVRKSYDRVIVFAGYYSTEDREKFASQLCVPLLVVDNLELRRLQKIDMIRPGDFAVYVTSATSHPNWERVKSACKAADIPMVETAHRNMGILKRIIEQHVQC